MNEKNRVCAANSGLVNLAGGVVIDAVGPGPCAADDRAVRQGALSSIVSLRTGAPHETLTVGVT
jgi:hypothetical protein